jgi:hypothetical protein
MNPDNYDQFRSREARAEAWLARCPVCSHCRKPIQDERCFVINGEIYHPDCAEMEFLKWTDDYME